MHIVVIYNYCLAMVHWNITNETRDKTGANMIQTTYWGYKLGWSTTGFNK